MTPRARVERGASSPSRSGLIGAQGHIGRAATRGITAGFVLDGIALVVVPQFIDRLSDLLVFPAACALLAVLVTLAAMPVLSRRAGRRVVTADGPTARPRPRRRRNSGGFALLGSLVLALGLYAARAPARHWTVAPEALIYGLDGATSNVIDPMRKTGDLPAFERLAREGASGELLSFEPSVSPILWTTIATGVTPEKHGVHSFYSTRDQLRAKRIWEVLEEDSLSVGIFHWYVTWPPPPTRGFLVPDFLGRDSRSIPPEYGFVNEVRNREKTGIPIRPGEVPGFVWDYIRHGVRLRTCLEIARELGRAKFIQRDHILTHVAMRRAELRMNSDIYRFLLRRHRPDFTVFYDNGTDTFGHYYWQYFEPEKFQGIDPGDARRYGSIIPDYYRLVDRELGTLIDHLAASTTVLVCSDHGHMADTTVAETRIFPKIETILEDLSLGDHYYGLFLGAHVFIESVKSDREEARAAIDSLAAILGSIRVVENGDPAFVVEVLEGTRITFRFGPTTDAATQHLRLPDGREIPESQWALPKPGGGGTHRQHGILYIRGPAVIPGATIPDATLLDVAPTLYRLLDRPLSRELDGRVLETVIRPDFRTAKSVRWVDTFGPVTSTGADLEVDDATREKLRSLGYIQ